MVLPTAPGHSCGLFVWEVVASEIHGNWGCFWRSCAQEESRHMSECGQDFSRAGCSGPDGSGGRFCPPAPGFAGVFSLGGELNHALGFS